MRRITGAAAPMVTLALAGCTISGSVGASSSHARHPGPSSVAASTTGPTRHVTCRAVSGAASRDRAVLLARARRLGHGAAVTTSGTTAQVDVAGVTTTQAAGLCGTGAVALRPLVAPTVPTTGHGTAIDPLTDLGFPVPADESAYGHLSSADQQELTRLLSAAACRPQSALARKTVVACGSTEATTGKPGSAGTMAALVAAPIVDTSGIESAAAQPPGQNSTQWTVTLRLRGAARNAWAAYTTAHAEASQGLPSNSVTSTGCGPTSVPCADWVAFVVDGKVVSLPVTQEPITGGDVQISGGLTPAGAAVLAVDLDAGLLPVPLTVASVR